MKDLAGKLMAWEDGQLSEEDTISLFQYLVDSGLAWTLQGMYGRTAMTMIHAGVITAPKDGPR